MSSTTTEVAQQQVSAPLIVDPGDSAGQPPLILATGSICSDANGPDGQAWAIFLNVDAYHYPPYGPFLAYYDWVFAQGAVEVSAGTSKTSASGDSDHVLSPGQLAPGTYLFTVTDRYLGLAASAEIVVAACVPGPALPAPWPPVAAIPAVECAEEAGDGRAWIAVHNTAGDDGSARSYSVKVTQGQSVVKATAFEGPVADDSWAVLSDYIDEGIYDVVIVDDQDPALTASVELVVPPCPGGPPPAPTDPPLVAPTITADAPCFAAPEASSNVGLHLVNNHFDQFGGNVSTVYEVVIGDGDGGVHEFFDVDLYPGTTLYTGADNLAPGVYVATLAHTTFPDVADSVTFTVEECVSQIPQPEPAQPLLLTDVQLLCLPGDATETLVFAVENHGFANHTYQWMVIDGQSELSGLDELLGAGDVRMHVVRPLVAGDVAIHIQSVDDPADSLDETVTVAPCPGQAADPTDPTVPSDPTLPTDPTVPPDPTLPIDPTVPPGPTVPSDPVDSIGPSQPVEPLDPSAGPVPGAPGGSLPATGTTASTGVVVAAVLALAGVVVCLATRRS